MSYSTLPLTPRQIRATESVLERVYAAARLGLKGDKLALASGLLPSEFNRLSQQDPVVELAALKGLSDGERELSKALHDQALNGDVKALETLLKHVHKWTAPQQVNIQVEGRISITAALEAAEKRVIEGIYTTQDTPVVQDHAQDHAQNPGYKTILMDKTQVYKKKEKVTNRHADADIQCGAGTGADGEAMEPVPQERSAGVGDVRFPVGPKGHAPGEFQWPEGMAERGS